MNILKSVWFYICLPFVLVGKILVTIETIVHETHENVENWAKANDARRAKENLTWATLNDELRNDRLIKTRAIRKEALKRKQAEALKAASL